jgi:hypothetical protein
MSGIKPVREPPILTELWIIISGFISNYFNQINE